MVAPYLGKNPAFDIASFKPNSSNIAMLAGRRDSPTCSLGNLDLSHILTERPDLAAIEAAVLPAGPPPITNMSTLSDFCNCLDTRRCCLCLG